MNSIRKNTAIAVVFGALAALFPSVSMAADNEESVSLVEETDSSTEELSTQRICESFCQAEYIDCLDLEEPRAGWRGGYYRRRPPGLASSECHRRYRRCIRRCD
ncbi:hypothetical protein [Polyangium sp. 15x6]|uniref:hypothetical protein n=1 Tax=Polyangium sp. 15x6 TaxID=3042687 RepID=UPI00249A9851|nr:hypothetical protein [Polyangium sp. 15x6]MDI3287266.1 hypothetical protein [Polyangium sp. 15x6]